MAILYITEYQHSAVDQGRALPVGGGQSMADQTVNITGAHAESSPMNAFTHFVRVECDVTCSIKYTAPGNTLIPATTVHARMAANQTEYFGVDPGGIISVIANT